MRHFLSGLGWAALGAAVWTAPQWWVLMGDIAKGVTVAIALVAAAAVIGVVRAVLENDGELPWH